MIKSTDRQNSRYVQGGQTDQFSNRVGFWQRRKFQKHQSDLIITIDARYDRKPWLVAYDKYNDVELMWFVLQYNTILDINTEFVVGKTIQIPTKSRLYIDILSRGTGSVIQR